MSLSSATWVLAGVHAAMGVYLLLRGPAAVRVLRALPRHVAAGSVLMLLGTAWFVSNLYRSDLTDFAEWRPVMYGGFTLLGIGCCFFVRDHLFIRGASVVALLVCDRLLDIQRWHPSGAKNVVTVWAYLVICLSVWFSMSPWVFRDGVDWLTATPRRLRVGGGMLALLAVVFGVLAAVVYPVRAG